MKKEIPSETTKKCWHCKKPGDEVTLKRIELCSDGLDIFHPLVTYICQKCYRRLEIARWAVVISIFAVTMLIVVWNIVH